MSLTRYKEIENFSIEQIQNELFVLRKQLFELKAKRSLRQSIAPHLFSHTKRRISHLKLQKSKILATVKISQEKDEIK